MITDEDLLGLVSDNMDSADTAGWEVLDLHVSVCHTLTLTHSMRGAGGRMRGDTGVIGGRATALGEGRRRWAGVGGWVGGGGCV